MVQEINGNYVRRTSSGVMKCGSTLSFGSKARNAEWDEHYKEVDAQMKRDKKKGTVTGQLVPRIHGKEV